MRIGKGGPLGFIHFRSKEVQPENGEGFWGNLRRVDFSARTGASCNFVASLLKYKSFASRDPIFLLYLSKDLMVLKLDQFTGVPARAPVRKVRPLPSSRPSPTITPPGPILGLRDGFAIFL